MTGSNTSGKGSSPQELESQTEEWNREIERLRTQSKEKMAQAQDPQTRQMIEEEFAREIQQRQDHIEKAREQAGKSGGAKPNER